MQLQPAKLRYVCTTFTVLHANSNVQGYVFYDILLRNFLHLLDTVLIRSLLGAPFLGTVPVLCRLEQALQSTAILCRLIV